MLDEHMVNLYQAFVVQRRRPAQLSPEWGFAFVIAFYRRDRQQVRRQFLQALHQPWRRVECVLNVDDKQELVH